MGCKHPRNDGLRHPKGERLVRGSWCKHPRNDGLRHPRSPASACLMRCKHPRNDGLRHRLNREGAKSAKCEHARNGAIREKVFSVQFSEGEHQNRRSCLAGKMAAPQGQGSASMAMPPGTWRRHPGRGHGIRRDGGRIVGSGIPCGPDRWGRGYDHDDVAAAVRPAGYVAEGGDSIAVGDFELPGEVSQGADFRGAAGHQSCLWAGSAWNSDADADDRGLSRPAGRRRRRCGQTEHPTSQDKCFKHHGVNSVGPTRGANESAFVMPPGPSRDEVFTPARFRIPRSGATGEPAK
jgi:hypothetical protein